MAMPASLETDERGSRLADPQLRREIEAVVRRRVSGGDAEDVVQAALADVLSAARVPQDVEEFRRFVFAVTRNKVFDHFRRRMREVPEDESSEPSAVETPLSARDILRWAETKLPDSEAEHTLEWMLREGDGEKLEQIARDANLPAPRVRQRVSRLRRFLRERWAAELMLGGLGLALLTAMASLYYRHWRADHEVAKRDPILLPEPVKSPIEQARELRRSALLRCEQASPRACLDELDRARALDPAGDAAALVVNARRIAEARLAPPPAPSISPSATPAPTALPIRQRAPAPRGSSESTSLPRAPFKTSSDSIGSEPTPAPASGSEP